MLHMMIRLLLLVQLIAWASPADAQQRFTQNPISLQRAAGADGDGSAITTKGYLSVALQVTGTFTATVNFEGTADAEARTLWAVTMELAAAAASAPGGLMLMGVGR